MAEELQSLLDRIYAEGVKKADAEAGKIVSGARSEAEKILAEARRQAENVVSRANEEAELLRQRAENAVRQAARDILLGLKAELEKRLRDSLADAADRALTTETMTEIVLNLARNASSPDISVICADCDAESLRSALKASLGENFRKNPKILADSSISGGLEVSLDGGEFYFDFTIPALTEMVSQMVGERIGSILEK